MSPAAHTKSEPTSQGQRHRPRTLVLACFSMLVVFLVGSAQAQFSFGADKTASKKQVTSTQWYIPQSYDDSVVSRDGSTLTTTLPPPTTIDRNFGGAYSRIKLTWGSGSQYPPSSWVQGVARYPYGSKIVCSSDRIYLNCRADNTWLRSLTRETTVRIEAGGAGVSSSKPTVDWKFKPAPDQVFVSRLNGPGSVLLGSLAEFEIRLDRPAPEGGLTIEWKIDPANCFAGLNGNVSYRPGAFNRLRIPAGQQYRSFALGTSKSCNYTRATLHTWVHERIDRNPNYKTVRFSLTRPRR